MKKPTISIIVPTYNSSSLIEDCLTSIKKQTYKDYELIIVDDASTDDTVKKIKSLGYKVFTNKKNVGYAKNTNRGFKYAKGKYILPSCHDLVYDKNALKFLVETIEKKNVSILGMKMYYYNNKNKIRSLGYKFNMMTSKSFCIGRDVIDNNQFDNAQADFFPAGAMLIRKDLLDKVGGFPEKYRIFYADLDLCYTAKKLGYRIELCKNAKVWHKKEGEKESQRESLRIDEKIRDKIIFMRSHSPCYGLFILMFLLIYTPINFIKNSLAGRFSFIRKYIKGMKEGFEYEL
jgi:GT2 family glycosyltransferase